MTAFYSVRSELALSEQLECNLLAGGRLDIDPGEMPFSHAVYSRNRARLPDRGIGQRLFDEAACAGAADGPRRSRISAGTES